MNDSGKQFYGNELQMIVEALRNELQMIVEALP